MPNTVYTLSYNYTDADVANRTYYYRLRAIDNTGGFTYSGVALVRRYNQQKIEILGNPFRTEVKMNIMLTQSKNVQVGMYDIAGRLIYMQQKKLNSGLNSYEIPDLDLLPKGMYQLEVIIDEQRWSQKVLKQ
ncbi:MAG TPA: T9SS type A sorting domain-containing protein [Flavisolibacter sp.]|nr:T9SS type A sorting domain-containing protein [Flavisolibacter sp.]